MMLKTQANRWSCLPTAFSMVTKISMEAIYSILLHDGSEILWPEQPEPLRRRGFHIEELQYVAQHFNMVLAPFAIKFSYHPNGIGEPAPYDYTGIIDLIMCRYSGLLLGSLQGGTHALAWNAKNRMYYDPAGYIRSQHSLEPDIFYAVVKSD